MKRRWMPRPGQCSCTVSRRIGVRRLPTRSSTARGRSSSTRRKPALRTDGDHGGALRNRELNQFLQQLSDVIRHLSFVEVLDVAVVAVILYLVLRLLRGTQGTQIVVGLILLAVIGVVATQFNLILLSWLFRNATFYIIIAIIVMFQPELRRVLDQLGRIGHIGRPLSSYNTRLYLSLIHISEP